MKYAVSILLLLSLVVLAACGGTNNNHHHHEVDKPTPEVPQAGKGKGAEDGGKKPEVDDGKKGAGDDKKEVDDGKKGKEDAEDKKRDRRGYLLGYGHYAPAYGLGYHGGLGYRLGYHAGPVYHGGLGYHGLGYHGLGWPYAYHG